MIKSTFSILFIVRKSRLGKSGEAAITMRITVNGRFTEMSTLRKVPANLWGGKKERAIGKGPIPIEINRHLESLRTRAYEIHKELVERDGYADPLTIKEYFQGKHISQKMFYATFEDHNERMAQLVGIEFDAVTLSRYRLCLRHFKEMISRKTKVADFPIKNLNGEMIRDFEAFLKIEKHIAQNTMIRYMKCLKKVVNLAIANGCITVNPFAGIKFSEKKVVKDFLTIEEVNTIRIKARYTFATTITLANNVKLENVSKMLGLTNTRMTLHYAHIMNESLAQEMSKVAAIMGNDKVIKRISWLVALTN